MMAEDSPSRAKAPGGAQRQFRRLEDRTMARWQCGACGAEIYEFAEEAREAGRGEAGWALLWKGRRWCRACARAEWEADRRAKAALRSEGIERGKAYWAARGIALGEKVRCFVVSWTGLGGEYFEGIAKAGKRGAYVQSNFQPGHLAPGGWHKAD